MIQSVNCSGKTVSGSAMLSQDQGISAGRQNLLSAIWRGRAMAAAHAMPNGDPPSLMLWGADDQLSDKRHAFRHSGK
jgi:hypothetical protein